MYLFWEEFEFKYWLKQYIFQTLLINLPNFELLRSFSPINQRLRQKKKKRDMYSCNNYPCVCMIAKKMKRRTPHLHEIHTH